MRSLNFLFFFKTLSLTNKDHLKQVVDIESEIIEVEVKSEIVMSLEKRKSPSIRVHTRVVDEMIRNICFNFNFVFCFLFLKALKICNN